MRAIDTNVVARFLLGDDPAQTATARRLITDGVFIPTTVLLETAWLLSSRYRFTPDDTARLLLELLDLATVTVVDASNLRWALSRAGERGDIADLLHLAAAKDADAFATFDQGVALAARPDSPVPIETLA